MTRQLEVKGQRPEMRLCKAGTSALRPQVNEATRSLEVKGRRPETVNGAWKAPLGLKRRGWMPRLSNQINGEAKQNA
jgi:hypothetical protein